MFFAFTGHRRYQGNPVREVQRRFKAFCQALFKARLHLESINDHINLVLAFLVQGRHIVNIVNRAIHPQADEALAAHGFDNLQVFALPVPYHRREDHQFAVLRHGHHLIHHLADGLSFQGLAMVWASRLTGTGKEQAQVIVYFGDGANGRARVVGGGFLLNGDSGRQTFDVVYVRLFHHRKKLAGIGGKRFYIAALSFRIKRIERKGRFPEPERPVITISLSRGISRSMFFRLWVRAPLIWIWSITPRSDKKRKLYRVGSAAAKMIPGSVSRDLSPVSAPSATMRRLRRVSALNLTAFNPG